MRAKPSAPATAPSCDSASAPARPISGSSGLKAPIEKQLKRRMKQSSAVLLTAKTSAARATWTASQTPCRRESLPAIVPGAGGAVKTHAMLPLTPLGEDALKEGALWGHRLA